MKRFIRVYGSGSGSVRHPGYNTKTFLLPTQHIPGPWYRRREKGLVQYFSMEETFVYCHNVAGLLQAMGCAYDPTEWRLFIDSCKASLKCALLHNGNRYASIPIGHSVHLKETYQNMLLTIIKYDEHKWMVCGDLKVLSILLGQQGVYTKYPCFLCL